MSRIVIVGGHGKVALRLARLLSDNADDVTSLVRDPAQVQAVEATGATAVLADVEHLTATQIAETIVGHDAIVWSAGAGGGDPERTYAVDRDAAIRTIDAAQLVGLLRFVMVSYQGARPDHAVAPTDPFFPYAEAKAAADAHLRSSALDWTILAPGRLTDEAGTGLIAVGNQPGSVPRDDVALAAAATLAQPATIGQFIGFIGGTTPIREALA